MYSGLTLLHIVANMNCMRLLSFTSLNHVRMNIVLSTFLEWWDKQTTSEGSSSTSSANPLLPSPGQVTKMEPLFFLPSWFLPKQCLLRKTAVPIFFGESFNDFCNHSKVASGACIAETLMNSPADGLDMAFGKNGYAISAGEVSSSSHKSRLCVDVVFKSSISAEEESKAYLHAILLGRALRKLEVNDTRSVDTSSRDAVMEVEAEVAEVAGVAWNLFQAGSELAGWDLTRSELQTLGFEIAAASQEEEDK